MSKEAMLTAEVAVLTEMVRVLSAKVEQQEQGEPVAWRLESGKAVWFERTDPEASSALPPDVTMTPLYTTPQQRTWVGLTDDELYEIVRAEGKVLKAHAWEIVQNLQAKLKEKNT